MHLDSPPWSEYEFAGCLDDNPDVLSGYRYSFGVVSTISDYRPKPGDGLVMTIGDPKSKLRVAGMLEERGAHFLSFIHPSVLLTNPVTIGRGVIVCPHSVISCQAELGDFVAVNLACTVGHDAKIGRGSTLSSQVDITGFVTLGEGVFVGSHASVLPKAKVGDYARIGAGSVVLRKVAAGATVMGVPAKQVLP
jgi:sugar O-acyltransferase (sialic acid O-acetyltransferase NeuD family)